jgi:hypothetical protein
LSGQRLMQSEVAACVLHQALGLAQQDGIASQSEDEIGIPIGHDQLHQLGSSEVSVAPQQEMSVGPVAA